MNEINRVQIGLGKTNSLRKHEESQGAGRRSRITRQPRWTPQRRRHAVKQPRPRIADDTCCDLRCAAASRRWGMLTRLYGAHPGFAGDCKALDKGAAGCANQRPDDLKRLLYAR